MVTELLKKYKRNIAYIELAKIRISEWKQMLLFDAITINKMFPKSRPQYLGNDKNKNISKPTEELITRAEILKDRIREWIKEEQVKIKDRKKQVKIVDILLSSLPEEDRFIMELKYKEHEKWHIIIRKFNKAYRDQYDDYITYGGIRSKKDQITQELESRFAESNLKI